MRSMRLLSLLVAAALLLTAAGLNAQPLRFQEGQHYQRLPNPSRVAPDSEHEVVEMFSYRCPHCFSFESTVKAWLEQKPDNVAFVRVPVSFGRPSWELLARAFYAAEELGVLEKMDPALFDAIHVQNQPLKNPEELAEVFAAQGVSKDEFMKAFESFKVETKVRRAKELVRRFRVGGVPMLVVDGEYAITGQGVSSNEAMFEVADFLLKRGS